MAFYIVLKLLLRSRYTRWGATDAEVNRSLPGDDAVPTPKGGYTQAITIQASPDQVWPWVAQIGQGRGGFYSYDFLENLVGCDIHSVNRIIPEYQHDETSQGLRLHPNMPPMPVIAIEPVRVLLFGGRIDPNTPVTWLFFLEIFDEKATRLTSRWRFDYKPTPGNRIAYNLFLEPIACVMQQKMLLGIKKRIESATK